jgi:hypothetical protein
LNNLQFWVFEKKKSKSKNCLFQVFGKENSRIKEPRFWLFQKHEPTVGFMQELAKNWQFSEF